MKASLLIAATMGFIASFTSMYIAWKHNPQCEFYCDGIIYWSHWLSVGVSWLLVGTIAALIVTIVIRFLIKQINIKLQTHNK